MAEKKPSNRSRKNSSPAPSRAGSGAPRSADRGGASLLDEGALVARLERGEFPASLYVDGPDESLKATLISEVRHAWARACPEAPHARVFRAGEEGVEQILATYQGGSLFSPRELLVVLEVEALARSERSVRALAEGVRRPAGGSCLVLCEGASETQRKSLDPVRTACQLRFTALPLSRSALLAWGRRRIARENVTAEDGLLEMLADACENDPGEFFNEIEKLLTCMGPNTHLSRSEAATLLRPMATADLVEYLAATALGDPAAAARRLGRVLAGGASEGTVLFALSNLVGGALGGWARWRDLSVTLARRTAPGDLARAIDALYRAEAAWKGGRADAVAVLEQATRVIAGAGTHRSAAASVQR